MWLGLEELFILSVISINNICCLNVYIFNTFDKAFVVYGLFYFAITLVTMLVTIFIIRKKEKQLQTVMGENDETK